jgi:HEAT repeat protein
MTATFPGLLALALALGRGAQAPGGDAPAVPASAPATWTSEEREAIELLRSLRRKERPSDAELSLRLSRAGDRLVPLFFDVLALRSVPALEEGQAQVLSEVQERAVLSGLGELERDAVLARIPGLLRDAADAGQRAAAIGCIGAVGRGNDFPWLFELAFAPDERAPDERLLDGLARAATRLLVRDPRAFETLASLRRVTRAELLPTLVRAAGATRDPSALAYLSEVVYWNEGLILDVMAQVPLLGPSGDEAVDGALKVRLRSYLDPTRPGPCRAAVVALAALDDHDAIAALIELLACEDPGLRENAHWGLKRLTGLALAPATEPWTRWHQGELYWLVRSRPREFQRLRESDPADVADAVRAILEHPLARRELASAVPDLLQSPWPALRSLACATLAELSARAAVPKLVWTLEDPDRSVAAAAHASLRRLTGLALPEDPSAWQAATRTPPRGTEP